jgi:hypothetical protein
MSAVRGGYVGGPGTKAIFDEAGSFMRLDRLGSYLDLARGGKMGVVYVLQSRAQLAAASWAARRQRGSGARRSSRSRSPTSDLQLARDIPTLAGERRVPYTRPRRHNEIICRTGEDGPVG